MFLGTLEQFNEGKPISHELQSKMDCYFKFRWEHNKNNAISTPEDFNLLIQLPESVQTRIYTDFLFKDVMHVYNKYFKTLKKSVSIIENKKKSAEQNEFVKRANTFFSKSVKIVDVAL